MSDGILDVFEDKEENRKKANRINGVVVAKVCDTKDPDKLARVKVFYPWMDENTQSDWVRVASFMAGKARGAVFLPDVDDEVLVAFEHGNVERPYIIGALYSSVDTPPETNADGKNNIKILKSREGHTITICDDPQKLKVEIKSKSGHTITLDDKTGGEKITIIDKAGSNKITIDSVGNAISIESQLELKLKATNITVEATAQLNLKGAMIKAEASGITEVKGSLVKIN